MDIQDLIQQTDILDYIAQYTDFQENNNEHWALSPLKSEQTPSFSVNREQQRFYDFSTGKGGDILTFIQAYHNCGFQKALLILKDYIGAEDNPLQSTPRLNSTKVIDRYKKRALKKTILAHTLPPDYMRRFENNPDKLAIWLGEGISMEVLNRFQVRYDPLSDRIVFPLRNTSGEIINVCGRTLDDDYKSKGLRKYTYFKKLGALNTLCGLYEHRQAIHDAGNVILFEGLKSVMMAETWGICNTAAVMTSHLNFNQVKILISLGVKAVIGFDENVNPATDKNIQKLKRYIPVEIIPAESSLLGPGMSPVDKGRAVWDILYERRFRL